MENLLEMIDELCEGITVEFAAFSKIHKQAKKIIELSTGAKVMTYGVVFNPHDPDDYYGSKSMNASKENRRGLVIFFPDEKEQTLLEAAEELIEKTEDGKEYHLGEWIGNLKTAAKREKKNE